MKSYIPNTITLLNLFCGIAALINILDGRFITAFWFLFAAGLFDFADGLVARMLNVSSEHGKELDSLADMVSFGVVPATIYYVLLTVTYYVPAANGDLLMSGWAEKTILGDATALVIPSISWSWVAAPALLIALFSCLRLAKFNLDTRQTENFVGVATPTSTLYATGLMLIFATNPHGWAEYVVSPYVLYPSILLFSYLLVSEHPMFSFKLKGLGWAGNETRIIFAALAVACLVFLQTAAFPFIVAIYLILNLVAPPKTSA